MKDIVVCIPRNKKGEVLLQKKTMDYPHGNGLWAFFGGQAESEDLEKEMKRELKEEIGVEPNVKLLFNMNIFMKAGKERTGCEKFHVFTAELDDASKISLNEGAGFAFFAKEELENLNLVSEGREVLTKFFEYELK